jgi:acyl-CoA thioesterase
MELPVTTRFDRDTAVLPVREGIWEGRIDRGWWVFAGPNGGYVGAILLRALEAAVGDASRAPRSLTIHYVARPEAGRVEVHARVERAGRSLTTVSARMLQEDRLLALALAAFSKPRENQELQHAAMPEVIPPERATPLPPPTTLGVSIRERFDSRFAYGGAIGSRSARAETGGWIRLAEPRRVDAPLVVAFADGWPPALFSHLARDPGTRGIPTVDLTVHFRETLPLAGARPDDWTLVTFRTRVVREGFLEEDGEIWSRDGRLLAHSRQLAVFA